MKQQKPSFTAFTIAVILKALAQDIRWKLLISKETEVFSDCFVSYCRKQSRIMRLVAALPPKIQIDIMDKLILRGMPQHYVLRKAFIEEHTRASLADGVTQVAVIGAGFDTLALRLSKLYPTIQFYELDQRATQQAKQSALAEADITAASNCHFMPTDLSQERLEDAMQRLPKFNRDAATLYVVEGVTMYLEENDVREIFTAIYRMHTTKARVVFGALGKLYDEKALGQTTTYRLLARRGERYNWSIPFEKMAEFLHEVGFALEKKVQYHELQQPYREENELAGLQTKAGENYFLARAR